MVVDSMLCCCRAHERSKIECIRTQRFNVRIRVHRLVFDSDVMSRGIKHVPKICVGSMDPLLFQVSGGRVFPVSLSMLSVHASFPHGSEACRDMALRLPARGPGDLKQLNSSVSWIPVAGVPGSAHSFAIIALPWRIWQSH